MNFFGGSFFGGGFLGELEERADAGPAGAGSKHRRIHPRYIYERDEEPEELPVLALKTKKKNRVVVTPLVEFLSPSFDMKKAASVFEDDDIEVLLLTIH